MVYRPVAALLEEQDLAVAWPPGAGCTGSYARQGKDGHGERPHRGRARLGQAGAAEDAAARAAQPRENHCRDHRGAREHPESRLMDRAALVRELLALLDDLVAIPSTVPPGDTERDATDF